jgi:hypothetical protein
VDEKAKRISINAGAIMLTAFGGILAEQLARKNRLPMESPCCHKVSRKIRYDGYSYYVCPCGKEWTKE